MSAGQAIRGMLTLPRPARRWATWQWAIAIPTLAFVPKLVGRLWTWLLLAALLGFALGMLPLFGVLGYELAIAAALFAAPMSLDVGAALARELQRQPLRAGYAGRAIAWSTLVSAGLAVTVISIPAVICTARGIVVPTCDWWFGIVAYVALPVVTAALGGALGHVLGVVAGPRRFAGAALAQLPVLLVAAGALWRFYSAPPVFTYNAILGYFPGNLYDENVQLTATLWWSRLEQLAWVVMIVALVAYIVDVPTFRATRASRPAGRRIGAIAIAVGAALGGTLLHLQSGVLGYAINAEDIEDALGGRIETAHFIIHYSNTPEIEEQIAVIAEDHELRYAQVVRQLGVEPAGKLRSFYFSSRDQKARWMGARDVEMAKPWRREIYLDHRAFPHGSLRHEIAHAVASEFGDPIFGVAMQKIYGIPLASPGLIEGLAVAIDWPGGYDRLTPHEAVRALQAMGKRPSIAQLLSLQFFTFSSATGYTTAGSFLRFLLDTYGPERLRKIYRSGGEFEEAYGKPLRVLEGEWVAMLQTIELPASAVEGARERFRGTSVFDRPCPHMIAKRREQAQLAAGAGDQRRAVVLMREVCGTAPDEPRYQLDLGDMLISGDPMEYAEAIGRWTSVARNAEGVTSSLRADALEKLARVAASTGDFVTTRKLIGEALALPVDSGEQRQDEALAVALDHRGPAGPALRGYFYPGPSRVDGATWALVATLAEPGLGFGHYLLGLQRLGRDDVVSATVELERGLQLGLPGNAFVKYGARRLAVAAYRAHDSGGVNLAITVLAQSAMSTSDRLLARDWLERLAFHNAP